jgi:MFS family permease
MVPALGLTMAGMGTITAWGFHLPYALFQLPGGMFGERFGARAALSLALGGCSVASLVTAALPAESAVGVLVSTRVLLGISQAAVFPVAAMAVIQYVPPAERVRAMAIVIATACCESCATCSVTPASVGCRSLICCTRPSTSCSCSGSSAT